MGDIDVRRPDQPGSSDGSSPHSHYSPTGDESSLDSNHDAPLDFSLKKSKRDRSPGENVNCRPGMIRSPELGQTAEPIKVEEMIGEPQTALPGVPPGITIPTTIHAGMLPGGFPSGLLPNMAAMGLMAGLPLMGLTDPKQLQNLHARGMSQPISSLPNGQNGANGKNTRPFKAYPKDPLTLPLGYFGLPGQNPFPGMDVNQAQAMQAGSEEMFKQYRDFYLKHQAELQLRAKSISPPLPGAGTPPQQNTFPEYIKSKPDVMVVAPTSTTPVSSPSPNTSRGTPTPPAQSPPSVSTTTPAAPSDKGGRKRTLPEEQKDQSYWERRRKNNDAAKRSRDSRRAKEDEIAIRAAFLEQENLKLRVEVTALKNETAKLRCMLYNS